MSSIGNANGKPDTFKLERLLHDLKHYLPSQTPLKDFIHHNSLHAFQGMKFYDGIFRASKIFGYKVTLQLNDYRNLYKIGRIKESVLNRVISDRKPSTADQTEWKKKVLDQAYNEEIHPRIGRLREKWKHKYALDIDNLTHPLLYRIVCGYLDQGISIWDFPIHEDGFLASIRALEKSAKSSFFKTSRAKSLLFDAQCNVEKLLDIIVGKREFFEQYILDQQFSHRGWSGMVSTLEDMPHSLLYQKKVSLEEFIFFELLMELDTLDYHLGKSWKPLCAENLTPPSGVFKETPITELDEVFMIWQDAFEWSYYDEVLSGINKNINKEEKDVSKKSFQAIFCIDERECSIRRHIENVDPDCETLGAPGFFGVEFYFQPEGAKFHEKLCPAPVTPKYLIKETNAHEEHKHEILYTNKTHTLVQGYLATLSLGVVAAGKLMQTIFKPKMSPAISNAFGHMGKDSILSIENESLENVENGLQVGFTVTVMADRVEGLFRGIGLVNNFAPIVYVVAHGSSSANNPHHGAHDCGACSGRPGCVNSRVLAFMANHAKVRAELAKRGLVIPDETQFVGAMHDTASDLIGYYDEKVLNEKNAALHLKNKQAFEDALDLNAKERSRRFASIDTKQDIKKVREAIEKRSVSLFEPRPELGHGTNTLCVVGRRKVTRGLFLDRRAFLNSYDYSTDLNGELLVGVLRPIGIVCGGINLEYYFSRVDNYKLGAGTKLPHNVMGLIGVSNSSDGDLRPGLPLQMIEVHDPARLLVIVEHFPEIVLKAIQTTPEMYEWYKNEWVHIMALNPETKKMFYFKNGNFVPYTHVDEDITAITDINKFLENAKEMVSNHILDATKENLPIHIINQ